ncbi:DUF6193 family natural product biosynthesis protein [Streptomyces sp. NPDC005435]|uniref:DUF6193 family natural product biosynthesis protein n=1 Tax=Streptomyces sp. NPDC005435 TaxID=3154464 RepID=UPI0034569198
MTDIVEAAWRKILGTAEEAGRAAERSPLQDAFTELVRAAHAEPRLRRLQPWTGMGELHFSRCTGFRPTWDLLYVGTLDDGRYYVEGPHRDSPRTAETGSARAAVALVVERLPPDCGPAFVGSADELAAYEETRGR